MSYGLLVSLDTETGTLRRYRRGPAQKAEKIGQDFFRRWGIIRYEAEEAIYDLIQAFRADWTPPEEPGPTAPPNMRVSRAA